VKRGALVACLLAVVAGVATGPASAKLSPVEQRWVTPVIELYNLEVTALGHVQAYEHIVIKDDGAGSALNALKTTLAVFATCPVAMKDVGAPPSVRLELFDHDMVVSCQHLNSGAEDIAHAVGEVRVGQGTPAATALEAATPQLEAGAKELGVAARLLESIGGKSTFEA
jgi:hypothetical protein